MNNLINKDKFKIKLTGYHQYSDFIMEFSNTFTCFEIFEYNMFINRYYHSNIYFNSRTNGTTGIRIQIDNVNEDAEEEYCHIRIIR
jgi:hypothetical protein